MAGQIDNYPGTDKSLSGPSRRFATITPHDTNALAELPKYLYVGATAGAVAIIDHDGNTVTLYAAAGQPLYVRPNIVKSTGTTATPIIACY
jgi:hypothetical protein